MSIIRMIAEKRDSAAASMQWGGIDWSQVLSGATTSGKRVNEKNAFKYSPFWAGVNIIAGAVGHLPAHVYKRLGRGKERAADHFAYSLVHDRPNKYMDAMTFRETLQAHVLSWGNGYAEIQRDRMLRPVAMWPLLPNRMEVKVKGGEVYYEYSVDGAAAPIPLPYMNVLHIKGLGFDGLKGYSVVRCMAENIGAGLASEEFGARHFGGGSVPGGVLQTAQKMSPEAREKLKKTWAESHQGLDNAHRVAVLEQGLTWQAIGIPARDAQLLETRLFHVRDMARWLQVPAHMLADNEQAKFSNIEHWGMEFVVWTLLRWITRWEMEYSYKLFPEPSRKVYFVEFLMNALLRGDSLKRAAAYKIAVGNGWMTRNEVRELENMNPLDGLDEPLQMKNMGTAAGESAPGKDGKANQSGEPFRDLFESTWSRIITKEVNALRKALKKPEGFSERAKEFYTAHEAFTADVLKPVFAARGDTNGGAVECARRYVEIRLKRLDRPVDEIEGLLAIWREVGPEALAEWSI